MGYDLKRKNHNSSFMSDSARENAREYQTANRRIRKQKEEDFFNKSLDYRNFVFAPEGFEAIMAGIYIILLPYLAGLAFLYLFVAEGNFEYFVEFDLASFLVIWAIGYETIAGSILIFIILKAIQYYSKPREEANHRRRDRF